MIKLPKKSIANGGLIQSVSFGSSTENKSKKIRNNSPLSLIKTTCFLALALVVGSFLISQTKVRESFVIKNPTIKQTSAIIAGGAPIKWSALIKREEISDSSYLLKLPRSASGVSVQGINADQVFAILATTTPPASLDQRVALATARAETAVTQSNFSVTNFIRSIAGKLTNELKAPIAAAVIVDLSDQLQIKAKTGNGEQTRAGNSSLLNRLAFISKLSIVARVISDSIILVQNARAAETDVFIPTEVQGTSVTANTDLPAESGWTQAGSETPVEPSTAIPVDDFVPPVVPVITAPDLNPVLSDTETEKLAEMPTVTAPVIATSTASEISTVGEINPDSTVVATTTATSTDVVTAEELLATTSTSELDPEFASSSEFVKVDFETPAPVISEQLTDHGKLVTISSLDENPATPLVDVLASTKIPKLFKVGEEDKINIKWKNNGDQDMSFQAYDTNSDGYLDYVEWTVPHLSEQVFEIIFISKAFLLDADQNIVADIYSETQNLDGRYTTVAAGQFVRVTFNRELDDTRDITVYARPTPSVIPTASSSPSNQLSSHSGLDPESEPTPSTTQTEIPDQVRNDSNGLESVTQSYSIEVYPVYTDADGNQTQGPRIATVNDGINHDFSNIDHEGKYRILLSNLNPLIGGATDVFDLRIVSSVSPSDPTASHSGPSGLTAQGELDPESGPLSATLQIDYIVDPSPATLYWVGSTSSWNTPTNWSTTSGGAGDGWVPTSADDVVFNDGGTADCTLDVDANAQSLTMTTGYAGTLDFGIYNMAVVGDSLIQGKVNIGISSSTGWTTNNLTIGASGTASSTATGTIYYNQVTVSGTGLSPDASDTYTVAGMQNGAPYFYNATQTYRIYRNLAGAWCLYKMDVGIIYWYTYAGITGNYTAQNGASGTATVANVATSGEYTRLNNSKVTIAGNYDQSATSSKFLAASSLITVNGNGNFTADGTVNSAQYNGAGVILNGNNSLAYNNRTSGWVNGINFLTVGQSGNTTTISTVISIKSALSVGSGAITGSSYNLIFGGVTTLNFNVSSTVSVGAFQIGNNLTQTLPSLARGYDCDILLDSAGGNGMVTQTGDVAINYPHNAVIRMGGYAPGVMTWKTDGYNLTVGGYLQIGVGNDSGLKKLDATNYGAPGNRTSTITVGGNWLNYGNGTASSTFVAASSTVIFNATSTTRTITSGSSTSAFNNLIINGTSSTYTLADNLSVTGDLNVTAGTLAIGVNNLAVTGNSTVTNATTTIGISAGTGWTTNNLTIGVNGTAQSTAAGTIYYNQVTVSGTGLSPDASGTYTVVGIVNGYPQYRRGNDNYWITHHITASVWVLATNAVGDRYAGPTWVTGGNTLVSTYAAFNSPASGTATVANVTASGEYTRLNNSKITIAGNYDQSATSSKFLAASSLITVNGNGTFTADGNNDATRSAQYNGASLVLNGSNTLTYNNQSNSYLMGFNNLTAGQNANTTTLTGQIAVLSQLTIGTGSLTGSSANVVLFGVNPLSFNASSTLSLTAIKFWSSTQSIPALVNGYDCNIELGLGSPVVTQTGNIVLNSNKRLHIGSTSYLNAIDTWNTNGYNLTVGGNIQIGQGADTGLKTLDATNYTNPNTLASSIITVGGNWLNYGNGTASSTFIAASSTVIMNSTSSSATITSGALNSPFYNLTLSGAGTTTLQDALVVSNNFTISNGTLDTKSGSNYPMTIGGNYDQSATTTKVWARSSTITLNNDGMFTADGTLASTQYNDASLVLNGSSTLTYNNLASSFSNGFNNLTAGQSGNTTVLSRSLAVKSVATIGSGRITGVTSVLFLNGASPLSFDSNSRVSVGTLFFYGANQTIPELANGYDCAISSSYNGSTITQSGNVVLNSANSIIVGAVPDRVVTWKTDGYNLTVGGNITIGAGSDSGLKTLNAVSGSTSTRNSLITVGGNWLNYGNGTASSTFVAASSTVVFNSSVAGKTITSGSSTSAFYNVNFTGVGGSYTLQDNFSVLGNLNVTAGILNVGSNNLAVTGNSIVTNATTTIGISSSTGWTTNNLTIGTGGVVSSTAVGTIYYREVTVSGTGLSPDATGTYTVAGMYDGYPYYTNGTFYLYKRITQSYYFLSSPLGATGNTRWFIASLNPVGTYTPVGATGTPTVANVTASGEYTRLNNSKVTIAGNFDQSATSSKFLAASSLITQNGNGAFTVDGTINSTQYNGATIAFNGNNTVAYTNLSSGWSNGFNNLIVGQGGSTTTLANGFVAGISSITVGTGELTGGASGQIYLTGPKPLTFDTSSRVSVANLAFQRVGAQTIPTLVNGYSSHLKISGATSIITQIGDVVLNAGKNLQLNGDGGGTAWVETWKTDGYNLTVGGYIQIGAGNDSGLKKIDATSGSTSTRNSIITVGGNWLNYGNGTAPSQFIAASSTVVFNSVATGKTITSGSSTSAFYNVNFTGVGGAWTLQDNFSALGDLNISAGTVAVGINNLVVTGNSTVTNATTTIGISSSTGWTTNNLTIGAGGVVSSTAAGTIYYNQVTVSGTGLSPDATGVYAVAGMYNGRPYYQRGTDNLYIYFRTAGSTWIVSAQVPYITWYFGKDGSLSPVGGYYTNTPTASGTATVANVTASGEYTRLDNSKVTIAGNFDQSATSSKFLAASSLITQNGNGTFMADGTLASTQYNGASLVLNGSSTLTYNNLSSSAYGYGNLTVGQNGNTTTLVSNRYPMLYNVLTVGSGTVTGSGLYMSGPVPLNLDTANSKIYTSLAFYGSGAKTLPPLTNGYNCSIAVVGNGAILTQTGDIIMTGDASIHGDGGVSAVNTWKTNGYNLSARNYRIGWGADTGLKQLDATNYTNPTSTASSTITVGGNWLNYGNGTAPSQFIAASSTVVFNKPSGTQTLTAGGNYASSSFYNLTHSGAGTLQLIANPLAVTNNFVNSAGTFDANGFDINVGGGWNNTATYLHGTSTVTLTGLAQSIMGTTTFYNLVKIVTTAATLTFEAAKTQIIAGALTLQGAANQLLTLVSSIPGVSWLFNPLGSAVLNYLNISDATNVSSTPVFAYNTKNATNNTNLFFMATTVTWTGASSTDWNDAGNWDVGYVPNITDNVVIASSTNQPIISTSTTVNDLTVNAGATLAIGTNDLTVTGDSLINGTTTIGISAGTGWTTNNLTIGAGGTAQSTAAGTIYYNQVTVTCSANCPLSPDASGTYTAAGMYGGAPYYKHSSSDWWIWYTGSAWRITSTLGTLTNPRWGFGSAVITGAYTATGGTGTATVANVTASGEYTRLSNSKITIAGNFDQSATSSKFLAASSLITVNGNGNFTADGTVASTQYNGASLVLNGVNNFGYFNLSNNAYGFNNLIVGQNGNITTASTTNGLGVLSTLTIGSGELTRSGGGTALLLRGTNPLGFHANSKISNFNIYFFPLGSIIQNIPELTNGYDSNLLVHLGSTSTQAGNITINGTHYLSVTGGGLTYSSANWNTNGYNLTVGGYIQIGMGADTGLKKLDATSPTSTRNSTITVGGNWLSYGTGSAPSQFIAASSTVIFNSTVTGKTITSGTTNSPFNNVQFNGTGGAWTLQDNFTATSTTLTQGTLIDNGKTVTVNGDISISGSAGSVLTSTGNWIQGASGNISNSLFSNPFYALTMAGSGVTSTMSGDVFVGWNITGGGAITMGPGVLIGARTLYVYPHSNDAITVNSLSANSQISNFLIVNQANITQKAITLPNNFVTNKIKFWPRNTLTATGDFNFGNNAVLVYDWTGVPTNYLDMGASALIAGAVTVGNENTYGGYLKLGSSASHSIASIGITTGNTNTSNIINFGTGTTTISGNIDFTGITVTPGSSAVILTSTSSGATLKSAGQSFNNLIQNGTGGTYTLQDALTASGTLTLTAGTLAGGTQTITNGGFNLNGGTFTGSGAMAVNGNLIYTSGTNSHTGVWTQGTGNLSWFDWNSRIRSYGVTGTVTMTGGLVTSALSGDGTIIATGQMIGFAPVADNFWTFSGVLTGGQVTFYNYSASRTNAADMNFGSANVSLYNGYGATTLTANGAFTTTGTLRISGNLVGSYDILTVNGNLSVGAVILGNTSANNYSGVLNLGAGTHSIGSIARGNVANLNNAINFGTGTTTVSGNIDFTGIAVTPGSSTVILTSTSSSAVVTSTGQSFYNLTVNGTGGTYTLADNASVTGNLNVTAGTLAVGVNNLAVTGNSTISNATTTIGISSSTGWTTNNLTIGAGGTASSTAVGTIYYREVTVSGAISPELNGTYQLSGSVNGAPRYQLGSQSYYLRYAATGGWILGATSDVGGTVYFSSAVRRDPVGSYTAQGSFSGSVTVVAVPSSGVYQYYDYSRITIAGNYDQSATSSKFLAASSLITVNGDGNFTADGTKDSAQYNGTSLVLNGVNTLTYNNITNGNSINGFNNLTVGQNGNTTNIAGSNNRLTVRSVLAVGSGSLIGSTFDVWLTGASPLLLNEGSNIAVSYLRLSNVNQTLPSLVNGYNSNIELSGAGVVTQVGDIAVVRGKGLYLTTQSSLSRNATWYTNGYNLSVGSNFYIGVGSDTGRKTLDATNYSNPNPSANSTITIGGNWINYGNGTAGKESQFIAASSTVIFNSTSTGKTITSGAVNSPFYNLQFNGTGGAWTLRDPLVVTGNLTHTAGTLNPSGQNITTTGNLTIADGALVTVSGLNSSVYYNQVQVSGTGLSPDATGVYAYAGMYNGKPYYQRGSDNYYLWFSSYSGPFWYLTPGHPVAGLPVVSYSERWSPAVVNGAIVGVYPAYGTASGTATVANVTSSGFIGSALTIGGNFNASGHDGALLALNPGNTWYLNVAGTANADYVNVANSNASGGTMITQSNSTDSGNNVNWGFDLIGPSIATTTASGFTTFANYIRGTGTVLGGYATDTISGIDTATCEYTLNAGTSWLTAAWNTDHCEKTNVTINDSEYYTFNTRAKDNFGNQGTGTSTITYTGDTLAPTTTDDSTSVWANTDQTITFTSTDGTGSGVSSTYYCLDTDGTCTPTTLATSSSVTVVGASGTTTEQYVRYYSIDNLGNTESIKTSNLVRIDKAIPVISNLAPASGSTISKSGQTVTFTTSKPSTCRFSTTAKSFDEMIGDYSCSVANSIQMTCALPDLNYGTQNFYFACSDSLGNKDTADTATFASYNVPQPPSGGFIFWPSTPTPVITLPTTTSSTVAIVTTTPKGVPGITINKGTKVTTKPKVIITLTPTPGTTAVIISTNPDFSGAVTLPFVASPTGQASIEYDLCQGQASCLNQNYTVYTKFLDAYGTDSPAFSANIVLNLPSMNVPTVSIGDQIKTGISNLLGFFMPQTDAPMNYPSLTTAVPKETPIAFQKNLILTLPSLNSFVFAALPRDFMTVANKFPQVASALKNAGITRISAAGQLEVAKVSLPGLAEAAGLSGFPNLAIADLTKTQSQQVPTNMVFARGGDNNLDLNVNLSISNQGTALQTLNTIQGHPLTLAIKPDQPAKTVKGYLIFKSNRVGEAEASSTTQVIPALSRNLSPRNLAWIPSYEGMTGSVRDNVVATQYDSNDSVVIPGLTRNLSLFALDLFATPASAMEMKAEVNVGNTNGAAPATTDKTKETPDLVLAQFDYKESANGIWTADVASPLVLGQYELRTVVDYKNAEAAPETVSMVVIVDPEGYVFRKLSDGSEARITNASVSIYWLNPETKKYELWPAMSFRQDNPQTTDVTGRYAFLVPPGDYYLTATAGNYGNYQSEIFKVEENKGVFMNIELKEKASLVAWLNLQNILLGGILLVLAYFAVLFTIKRKMAV